MSHPSLACPTGTAYAVFSCWYPKCSTNFLVISMTAFCFSSGIMAAMSISFPSIVTMLMCFKYTTSLYAMRCWLYLLLCPTVIISKILFFTFHPLHCPFHPFSLYCLHKYPNIKTNEVFNYANVKQKQ